MRIISTFGLCLAAAAVSTVSLAAPASADNPACPTNYTAAQVIRIVDGHYRAKACYRAVYDDFAFQDTYVDGWGADFSWPTNDMTDYNYDKDTNGANNGWIYENAAYPNGRTDFMTICSYDFSLGQSHGCSTTSFNT